MFSSPVSSILSSHADSGAPSATSSLFNSSGIRAARTDSARRGPETSWRRRSRVSQGSSKRPHGEPSNKQAVLRASAGAACAAPLRCLGALHSRPRACRWDARGAAGSSAAHTHCWALTVGMPKTSGPPSASIPVFLPPVFQWSSWTKPTNLAT
eukprot:scaffold289397_cov30-Tisochrysis_lutea.AAC.5